MLLDGSMLIFISTFQLPESPGYTQENTGSSCHDMEHMKHTATVKPTDYIVPVLICTTKFNRPEAVLCIISCSLCSYISSGWFTLPPPQNTTTFGNTFGARFSHTD